jgi:cytochrome c biogenesis protein CcmG, thiol:disulfide interchange protein DsbE
MKKLFLFLLTFFSVTSVFSQEDTKFDWARPFLGKKAPALNVKEWITEKPDTTGKFIILDFWSTFCGPCVKFIPQMNKFSKKFKKEAVFIAITLQSKESMEKGLQEIKKTKKKLKEKYTPIIFYQATDPKAKLFNTYSAEGYIPLVIIIDPDGIVRWQGNPHGERGDGEGGLTEEVIRNIITAYSNDSHRK